jgi:hypothetical protein
MSADQAPLQTSATDPEELEFAQQTIRARKSERLRQVREQLSTEAGRKFVWELLLDGGLYEDISGPVEVVYRSLGRRNWALKLYAEVNRHPELFMHMQQEAVKRDREDRRVRAKAAEQRRKTTTTT